MKGRKRLLTCTRMQPTQGQPVVVDDEGNGFKQDSVLRIGVLNLLGLGRLLGFVKNRLKTLGQAAPQRRILCNHKPVITTSSSVLLQDTPLRQMFMYIINIWPTRESSRSGCLFKVSVLYFPVKM